MTGVTFPNLPDSWDLVQSCSIHRTHLSSSGGLPFSEAKAVCVRITGAVQRYRRSLTMKRLTAEVSVTLATSDQIRCLNKRSWRESLSCGDTHSNAEDHVKTGRQHGPEILKGSDGACESIWKWNLTQTAEGGNYIIEYLQRSLLLLGRSFLIILAP